MDYQPPPFFSRGPAPLARLGFFVCLAVLLMVLDARFRYAESLRQVVALLAYPERAPRAAAGRQARRQPGAGTRGIGNGRPAPSGEPQDTRKTAGGPAAPGRR